jgi:hypothetical protein
VPGEVAHPLQGRADAQRRDDDAKVGRDRRLLGQQVHAALVQLALELVDGAVGGDDVLRELVLAVEQRRPGPRDRGLDESAHLDQAVTDLLQLGVEDLSHGCPLEKRCPATLPGCPDRQVNAGRCPGEQWATRRRAFAALAWCGLRRNLG